MKFTQCTSLSLLGSSLLLALPSAAESPRDLNDIVVTGTRTATDRNHIPDTVKIFTREDIERLQPHDLTDLLKGHSGFNISNNGGKGKATSFFVRGTNSDHVLVLIDGVKVGSATIGSASFQHYPVDQVERIEIVKGPHSSLYGSEAIGGVIQIFTRQGTSASPKHTVSLGYGNDQTYKLDTSISGRDDKTSYNLGVSHFNTGGFDSRQPTLGLFGVNKPDDDGYLQTALSAKITHQFTDKFSANTFFLRSQGTTEFDASDDFESDILEQVFGGSLQYAPFDFWTTKLSLGISLDQNETFTLSGVAASEFNTKRFDHSWSNIFTINPNHLLTLGFDYQNDKISGTTTYDESSRNNKGIFAQYQGSFGYLDVVTSLRNDDNEAFGDKQTGSAGFSLGRFSGIRVTGSYGTAFKGPSFNELYFPNFGNVNLNPESSRSYELGIDGEHGVGYWSISAYKTKINDLIDFTFNPVTFEFKPLNINKAVIKGLEVEAGTEIAGWDLAASLSVMSPKDSTTDKQLRRRSRRSARLDISRDFGQFNLGGSIIAYDHNFDDAANAIRVAGYSTVDLRGSYTIDKRWSIHGHINNLLDKNYQSIYTYNQDDINAMLTVRYQSR